MAIGQPQTALQALAWRRLPISAWPWRSTAYLLAGLASAAPAVALMTPWLVLARRLAAGEFRLGANLALVGLGSAIIVTAGPLLAPIAAWERRRLAVVDRRPTRSGHRHPGQVGALALLRARYGEPATWREVGYLCLLGTVIPAISVAGLTTVLMLGAFVASPFLVLAQRPGDLPITIGVTITSLRQAVAYAMAGLVLLPVVPYLLTLLAGANAAVARALLGGTSEQLHAQLTEVTRSRARLVDAFDAERRRIERDLHDGAQQKLVSLTMQLGVARLDLPPETAAGKAIVTAHEQAKQLMEELRALIHGIRPQTLADAGLEAAIDELAGQSTVPVAVGVTITGRLPEPVENTAYFVIAEALTNIAKHSGATNARVSAWEQRGQLIVEIRDDGHGGANPSHGSGLTGLADRIAVFGGRMLLSSPDGGPTLLRVELPCQTS